MDLLFSFSLVGIVFLVVLLGLIPCYFFNSVIVVRQNEAVIIETFGKFKRIQNTGVTFIIPFIQNVRYVYWLFRNMEEDTFDGIDDFRIPTNELRYDPKPIACTTADNLPINVDLVVSFSVSGVTAAAYMNFDPLMRMEDDIHAYIYELVRTFELNAITPVKLNESINLRELNLRFKETGMHVSRIFVQTINLPGQCGTLLHKIAEETLQQKAHIDKINFEREMSIAQKKSKLEEIRAQQEIESAQLTYQTKINAEKANAQMELNRMAIQMEKERSAMLSEFPDLLPLYELQERNKSYEKLAQAGQGKKVIVLPLEGLSGNGITSLPIARELLNDRVRTRSPRRPKSTDKAN